MTHYWLKRIIHPRNLSLALFYVVVCAASYYIGFELRFDFNVPEDFSADRISTIWWVIVLKLMLLTAFGQIHCVLSYFRLPDALRLFFSLFIVCIVLLSMWYIYEGDQVPPRAVILSDFLLSFLAIAGFRVVFRIKASRRLSDWFGDHSLKNVIIVGAGEVGATICSELMDKPRLGMRPVGFLDDNPAKIGRFIHGLEVVGSIDDLIPSAKRYQAEKVVVAFPSASSKRLREVFEIAKSGELEVDSVPALTDIVSGRARVTSLRPIELEDLLGREPVDLQSDAIQKMLSGKRVLVTGAGGSIGRELVVQILEYGPSELVCVDQAEIAIFNLRQEVLQPSAKAVDWETYVLNVGNAVAMRTLLGDFRPEVLFHAAAHKHVNLMEAQPAEALRNNFFATKHLAALASESGVEHFVFISTDKAINPTSVMGVSKRLAELALLEQQAKTENQTKFMSVRFGNVLGSSGSVVPIFRKQIASGGPVTVTDPEVTRFFMTVQEAIGLVLQSATQGVGGEIFVLDMGESMKILDLAKQMIHLSGMREGEDIDIEITGLKPGEKRFEEVQHLNETLQPTTHRRISAYISNANDFPSSQTVIEKLEEDLKSEDLSEIKESIQQFIPEYVPSKNPEL
ncbi:MAG: polysaccharide biosynthesis protein [Coraliomargaritaceae bacterium]